MSCLAVVTTVATRAQALQLARALVERGLAACAQIAPIDSVYRWQGELREEPEYRIVFKTTAARWPEVEQAIRAGHPYDLPAIHALAFEQVDAAYAAWIEAGSAGP
jgi:periplasmic divalent cation tolerance protein